MLNEEQLKSCGSQWYARLHLSWCQRVVAAAAGIICFRSIFTSAAFALPPQRVEEIHMSYCSICFGTRTNFYVIHL